jgi:hypothetical protein
MFRVKNKLAALTNAGGGFVNSNFEKEFYEKRRYFNRQSGAGGISEQGVCKRYF